jgi:hypothetical protein
MIIDPGRIHFLINSRRVLAERSGTRTRKHFPVDLYQCLQRPTTHLPSFPGCTFLFKPNFSFECYILKIETYSLKTSIRQFKRKYQVLLFVLIPLALYQWLRLGKMMPSRHKCVDLTRSH